MGAAELEEMEDAELGETKLDEVEAEEARLGKTELDEVELEKADELEDEVRGTSMMMGEACRGGSVVRGIWDPGAALAREPAWDAGSGAERGPLSRNIMTVGWGD